VRLRKTFFKGRAGQKAGREKNEMDSQGGVKKWKGGTSVGGQADNFRVKNLGKRKSKKPVKGLQG